MLKRCACFRYERWKRGLNVCRRREEKDDDGPKRSGKGIEVGDEAEESKT